MSKRLLVVVVAIVLGSLGLACLPGGNHWSVGDARRFDGFPLYWLGESYQGLDVTEIYPLYLDSQVDFVSIGYGQKTCGEDGSTCWNPVTIFNHPFCGNSPTDVRTWLDHLVSLPGYSDASITDIEVRGLRAILFGESRIYLWTGTSSLIVDSHQPGPSVVRVAEDLIPVSEDFGDGRAALPTPVSTRLLKC